MSRQVLLLHGFTHTGASWAPVVGALGERYRALAPDIRGHGSASERRPVNLAGVLEDLAGVLEDPAGALEDRAGAGARRLVLVGYSMGGRLALHVALDQPERIERLILIGASPGLADASERAARRQEDEALAAWIERSTLEEFAARWARTPVLAGLPEEVARDVHQNRLRNTPSGLAAALRGLGTGALPPLWERLGALSMPVSLVAGERDLKFRAIAAEMARLIPHAHTSIVRGAGHAVHLEAPDRVAAIISADPPTGPR